MFFRGLNSPEGSLAERLGSGANSAYGKAAAGQKPAVVACLSGKERTQSSSPLWRGTATVPHNRFPGTG